MEDTTKVVETQDEAENVEFIEEMIRNAEVAEEPGEVTAKQVVHKGDKEVPVPMIVSGVTSAGYIKIYDTKTGEVSITNRNMLPTQLKKKHPDDGTNMFTTVNPHIPIKVGTYKCKLHPDDPDRRYYDSLGLPVCKKANLTSPFQVRRHMEKRHKMEWGAIEQQRADREKAEDRKLQQALIKSAIKTQKSK